MIFPDRAAAGALLAQRLWRYAGTDCIVLALPRGGVEVGFPLAELLGCPFDVIIAKKIGEPFDPECAVGAVSEHQVLVTAGAPERYVATEARRLQQAIWDQRQRYTHGAAPDLRGRTAIIVDDGAATGFTARAAMRYARTLSPKKVVVALPVASRNALSELSADADEIVCISSPADFVAVEEHYDEFPQIGDERVVELLRRKAQEGCAYVGRSSKSRTTA